MSGSIYYAGQIYLGDESDLQDVQKLSWRLPAMDGDRFAKSAAVSMIGQRYEMRAGRSVSLWRIVSAVVVDDGAAIDVGAERVTPEDLRSAGLL